MTLPLLAASFLEASPPTWLGLSADDWIKTIAVAIGAAWTLMNFIRGRTYRKRLDVDVPGTFSEHAGVLLITGETKAKNLGSSEIPILSYGTGVSIYALWMRRFTDGTWDIVEERIETHSLVEKDAWIEPGETFRKPHIVAIPESRGIFVGIRSEVLINNGKTVWTVSQICDYTDPNLAANSGKKDGPHA